MLSTVRACAMRVHIKWRVVLGAVLISVLLLVTYKVLFSSESCGDEYPWDDTRLSEYCNPPQNPATGLEGDALPAGDHSSITGTLVSVHVIIRHGDRTAIHSLPHMEVHEIGCQVTPDLAESVKGMDNYYDTMTKLSKHVSVKDNFAYKNYTLFPNEPVCAHSALTPRGAAQHVRNGLFLREKYSRHGLMEEIKRSNGHKVFVRGTRYVRTFHSAIAFLHGFLPEFDIDNVNFEIAESNAMCTEHTEHQCQCPLIDDFVHTFASTFRQEVDKIRREDKRGEAVYTHVKDVYQRFAKIFGVPAEEMPVLSHIFDVVATHHCHGKRLMTSGGKCVDWQLILDLYKAVSAIGGSSVHDEDFRRISKLKMQPLIYEIAHRMRDQAANNSTVKFTLYSGHDTTVDPFAMAIGINRGIWPKYASRLVLELYETPIAFFLRALSDGNDVTSSLTFCQNDIKQGLCPLDRFLEFANGENLAGIQETDYDVACQKSVSI